MNHYVVNIMLPIDVTCLHFISSWRYGSSALNTSTVHQQRRRERKTMSARNWQESGPLRWRVRSEHRKSITPCAGSRPGRRKQRSCTSSSASTQRTQYTWRGVWQSRKRPRRHKRHLKRN